MNIPHCFNKLISNFHDCNRENSSDILNTEERNYIQNVESKGYKLLGSGTNRVVFELNNNTIIKIARPEYNYVRGMSNRREYKQFKNATKNQKELLAPVYNIDSDNY